MNELSTEILTQAAHCFAGARKNLIQGAALLHKIASEKLYEPHYASFSDYLESECQIKDSFASKLIKVYQHYCVDGGYSQDTLESIDSEKLYLATSVDASLEKQLSMAQTLTRSELKEEIRDEDPTHEHVFISVCKVCWKRHE